MIKWLMQTVSVLTMMVVIWACDGSGGGSGGAAGTLPGTGGSTTGGQTNPVCSAGVSGGTVNAPQFVMNLAGQTGWFASPVVADLDGDGSNELIAAYYSVYVFDSGGALLDRVDGGGSRVYAPHVVADLEGDGIAEVVYGNGHEVYAYEWRNGRLEIKAGWPVDTTTAGESPEVRGMAAGDLDGDGLTEIVVTTTQTQPAAVGGAQVFAYSHDGTLYQPGGIGYPAWPRYNNASGAGGDADRNGQGHNGYGCYGLNVAIGSIDDDSDLEIIVTYDNHHIQAFDKDGVAIDSSSWFRNRTGAYLDQRLTWGQFIRWADPQVEENHYHLHTGPWPHPGSHEWLQWTASPPSIVDLDGDGRNEVVGVPNIEKDVPYVTQAYAVMALEGSHADGSRSARRKAGWEELPRGGTPISVAGWYPPSGIPAPVTVNIQGDALPEIVVTLNDGCVYAFSAHGHPIWQFNFTHGKSVMYASEVTAADLNQDGSPEIIFCTYGAPNVTDSGYLVILAADGALLHDVSLPNPGSNGNGNGSPAAPAVGDLDGDGQLEIFVQTFDHGLDVFTVPGSSDNCLLWPTARGGPLRMGQPNTSGL